MKTIIRSSMLYNLMRVDRKATDFILHQKECPSCVIIPITDSGIMAFNKIDWEWFECALSDYSCCTYDETVPTREQMKKVMDRGSLTLMPMSDADRE